MDILTNIFDKQNEYMNIVKKNHPHFWDESKDPFPDYRKFMTAYYMLKEITEYHDEIKFKHWKINQNVNEEHRKEELMDIFHFFVQLCLEENITPQMLHESYLNKLQVNILRQEKKY